MWSSDLWQHSYSKLMALSPYWLLLLGLLFFAFSTLPVSYCLWRSIAILRQQTKSLESKKKNAPTGMNGSGRSSISTTSKYLLPDEANYAQRTNIPMDVRIISPLALIVLSLIFWRIYAAGYAPVYEYGKHVPGDGHTYEIVGMNGDESQWDLKRSDGMKFRLDWCKGGDEYNVSNLAPEIGLTIVYMKYQDKGCKSIARQDTGILFDHPERND